MLLASIIAVLFPDPASAPHRFAISFSSPKAVEAVDLDSIRRDGDHVSFTYLNVPRAPTVIHNRMVKLVVADVSANCHDRSWQLVRTESFDRNGWSDFGQAVAEAPRKIGPNVLAGRELRIACSEVRVPPNFMVRMTAKALSDFAPSGVAISDR